MRSYTEGSRECKAPEALDKVYHAKSILAELEEK